MIYSKLSAIQKELIAPKGQQNPFGKYAYRSCEDILKAVKPLCEKYGCVTHITNDLLEIGDRFYVKATVRLIDIETGEDIVSVAHAREDETQKGSVGAQITGASSSYARKYALAGLFCIDNEKDADATNDYVKPDHDDAVKEAEARAKVLSYINSCGMTKEKVDAICKFFKVKTISEMNLEQCEAYLSQIEKNGGK